jgi:hypothetical protein
MLKGNFVKLILYLCAIDFASLTLLISGRGAQIHIPIRTYIPPPPQKKDRLPMYTCKQVIRKDKYSKAELTFLVQPVEFGVMMVLADFTSDTPLL